MDIALAGQKDCNYRRRYSGSVGDFLDGSTAFTDRSAKHFAERISLRNNGRISRRKFLFNLPAQLHIFANFIGSQAPVSKYSQFLSHRVHLSRLSNFVGSPNANRIFVEPVIDDNDIQSFQRVAPDTGTAGRCALSFTRRIGEYVLYIINRQAMFKYMLNIAVGIIGIIPNNA